MDLAVPAEVRQGDVVPLRLTARNTGTRPLTLEMGDSAYSFDFVVTGSDGGELWSRMHHVEAIPLALRERQLPPGGEIVFMDDWDLRDNRGCPVPPGRYTLHALIDADTMPHRMLRTPSRTLIVAPRQAIGAGAAKCARGRRDVSWADDPSYVGSLSATRYDEYS
ncbi:MAG TPA: BsuPI-related putative proteinase inhibitor [Longimicrobium sp.]|jgi:hypothetical protein